MPDRTVEQNRATISVAGDLPREEIDRLLALEHADPHSILGAHTVEGGVVVRAFRPNADKITLIVEGRERIEMALRHEAGIFEVLVPGRREAFVYQLEIRHPDGSTVTIDDPYSFLPTLEISTFIYGPNPGTSAHTTSSERISARCAALPAWRSRYGRRMRAASA